MDIDIAQLRQHLPDYLARVRQGERIRVMSRGRVVAEIVPPGAAAHGPAPAAAHAGPNGGLARPDDPAEPVPIRGA